MKNGTNTKRALMLSVLSLLICCVLFIGSTFAWFTDSASVSVGGIQSGELDVGLEMSEDGGATWTDAEAKGQALEFIKAEGALANEAILWEPGCTYELQPVTVVNKGNLALSYKLVITGIAGDAKLNEAIEWTAQIDGREISLENYTKLLEKGQSETLTVKGHMRENAGNEFMGLTISGPPLHHRRLLNMTVQAIHMINSRMFLRLISAAPTLQSFSAPIAITRARTMTHARMSRF